MKRLDNRRNNNGVLFTFMEDNYCCHITKYKSYSEIILEVNKTGGLHAVGAIQKL